MSDVRDRRVELALSRVLTIATAAAGAVTLVGLSWHVGRAPLAAVGEYGVFHPPARGAGGGWAALELGALDARAVMLAGVLLLILTPAVRVVFTLVAFAWRRDWVYVGLTLVVLAVLAYGMVGGKV